MWTSAVEATVGLLDAVIHLDDLLLQDLEGKATAHDALADFDIDSAEVEIFREQSLSVIDHDHGAFKVEIVVGEGDDAVGGRLDRRADRGSEVDAVMRPFREAVENALGSEGGGFSAVEWGAEAFAGIGKRRPLFSTSDKYHSDN